MRNPTPPSGRERREARRAHVLAWSLLAGAVVAAGGFAAVQILGGGAAVLALLFGTVVFGSCVLMVKDDGLPSYLLALRVGALLTCLVMASAGLVRLVGPVGFVLPAVVLLGWPGWLPLVRRLRGRAAGSRRGNPDREAPPPAAKAVTLPGRLDMSSFEAALADVVDDPPVDESAVAAAPLRDLPTAELCRVWRRTFVLLAQDISPQTTLELLDERDQCLRELKRREPAGYQALMASGATPSNDLSSFFHGSGDATSS